MENVKNKRCQVLGCEKVPSFGLPGGGPGPPSWPNDMGPFGILFIDHIEIPAKNPFGFTHALTMMDGFFCCFQSFCNLYVGTRGFPDGSTSREEKKGANRSGSQDKTPWQWENNVGPNKNCVSVRRLWENNVSTKPKRAHRKCSLWYYQRHAGTKKKAIVAQEQHPLSGMYKMSLCH